MPDTRLPPSRHSRTEGLVIDRPGQKTSRSSRPRVRCPVGRRWPIADLTPATLIRRMCPDPVRRGPLRATSPARHRSQDAAAATHAIVHPRRSAGLARRISALSRRRRSSTDRAPSAPTTGSPPGGRRPSRTSTEAWSQDRCSCASLAPSHGTTTTSATSTRFPVGGMPGSLRSMGIVWVNRATSSSTSRPWPMVRATGAISRSGGIWGKQSWASHAYSSSRPSPPISTGTWWTCGCATVVARATSALCAANSVRRCAFDTSWTCGSAAVNAGGCAMTAPS
jgi:hypothetical protein